MTHGTLATSTIAFLTLTSAAFSAAVIHHGTPMGLQPAGADQASRKQDTAHLRTGTKVNLVKPNFSLLTARPGSRRTLAGVSTDADAAVETASVDDTICAVLAVTASVAAAPAPAAENLGPASSFGAVPEPSSAVLLALGAASLLRRRRS